MDFSQLQGINDCEVAYNPRFLVFYDSVGGVSFKVLGKVACDIFGQHTFSPGIVIELFPVNLSN